jgi:hypothetical protein
LVILPVGREKNKGTAHCALRPVKPKGAPQKVKPRLDSLRNSVRGGVIALGAAAAKGEQELLFKSRLKVVKVLAWLFVPTSPLWG